VPQQPDDPITEFLRKQGASYAIVANGLRGLVENWERVVEQVSKGYPQGLDDYLNDMDGRQLLENALELASVEARAQIMPRVRAADHRMLVLLESAERCLWGPITAEDEGWTPERNWWYFQVPKSPGPTLQQELQDS
jgi:hypothetical protein